MIVDGGEQHQQEFQLHCTEKAHYLSIFQESSFLKLHLIVYRKTILLAEKHTCLRRLVA
jgi:hypothetical protein